MKGLLDELDRSTSPIDKTFGHQKAHENRVLQVVLVNGRFRLLLLIHCELQIFCRREAVGVRNLSLELLEHGLCVALAFGSSEPKMITL